MIDIIHITEDKKQYLPLLLLADPYEPMVNKYLCEGNMFILENNSITVAIAVVIPISDYICELKNIAVAPGFKHQGYGSFLLNYLCKHYSEKFTTMIVGTSKTIAPFYIYNGFEYSHTKHSFFTDNYPYPIYDGEELCCDMYYFHKDINGTDY